MLLCISGLTIFADDYQFLLLPLLLPCGCPLLFLLLGFLLLLLLSSMLLMLLLFFLFMLTILFSALIATSNKNVGKDHTTSNQKT